MSYAWNFGDGSQGSGVAREARVTPPAGRYTVTLTVTDDRGLSASMSQVGHRRDRPPTRSPPSSSRRRRRRSNDKVFFNAAPSTAAVGRTIVRYDWDYGIGRQDSGMLVWQIYTQPGSYTVVLTVTDDVGNKGTASKTVTVRRRSLAARSATRRRRRPAATRSTSTPASRRHDPIACYAWDFGDGGTATGRDASHVFACPGATSRSRLRGPADGHRHQGQTATTAQTSR